MKLSSMLSLKLVALSVALGGCSYPPYVGLRMPRSPMSEPATIEHGDETFAGVGGTRLFAQRWRPRGRVKAAFIVVHGLKDHSTRYRALAERLAGHGIAIYAFDLRGHGRSEGVRVGITSFEDYIGDLDIFDRRVRAREPGKPVFLFGHSMGGTIVTLYTLTKKPLLRGLLLSAPALGVNASGVEVFGTRVMSALSPQLAVFQLDTEEFSRDPAVVRSYQSDPLVYQGSAPALTARELVDAIETIQEHMEDLRTALLVLHGAEDKVTPPTGSVALNQRASSTDKTLRLYPKLYHDLLHEPEREQVITDIVAWVDARAPARP
ncbi:lysophospholipase [Sorangium sp. So ce1182]|uniref:alpha/beta hydrolase n=1 Tax=Sorangium sp. So ce1182 TaxID=3133334 RepID=UPI003F6182EB